jgi:hypothetical protein
MVAGTLLQQYVQVFKAYRRGDKGVLVFGQSPLDYYPDKLKHTIEILTSVGECYNLVSEGITSSHSLDHKTQELLRDLKLLQGNLIVMEQAYAAYPNSNWNAHLISSHIALDLLKALLDALIAGINTLLKATSINHQNTSPSPTNGWWTLKNMLLIHGLNVAGENKGDYAKNTNKPWPDHGEINCSIISPLTQAAYASTGLILRPTLPQRISYTDVGSYQGSSAGQRQTQGKTWTTDKLGMRELMFLTLAAGTYNEVHVNAHDTSIIGVFGSDSQVDTFVKEQISGALRQDQTNPYGALSRMLCHAMLQAEFYVCKIKNIDNNRIRWAISDMLLPGLEAAGYSLNTDIGSFQRLADDLADRKIALTQLMRNLNPESIFGGEFFLQPITPDHKLAISKLFS